MIPLNYSLKEIVSSVYRLHFQSRYQLAMHFLRMQEYYESPKYHGMFFDLVDYMDWYASEHNGLFTYPIDWSGFNVPGNVVKAVHGDLGHIKDYNRYDAFMHNLYHQIKDYESAKHPDRIWLSQFYLIGTSDAGYRGDEDPDAVLNHELAHAFWYLDNTYRDAMSNELDKISDKHRDAGIKIIQDMGYHKSTCWDELHAFCATGPCPELLGIWSRINTTHFVRLFDQKLRKESKRSA